MFFRAFRRSNITIKIMMRRMLGPATKPANCGEERTLLPSDLVGGVLTSFLSEHGNKIDSIFIKEERF